eukprot:455150_1
MTTEPIDLINITSEDTLKEIGIKTGFSNDNSTRLHCYSILLGCDIHANGKLKSDFIRGNDKVSKNDWSDTISKDMMRNGYNEWNKTQRYSLLTKKRDLFQITKLSNIFFSKYRECEYSQGLNSIFALFYLISNKNLFIANKLIESYFHIFKLDLLKTKNNKHKCGLFKSKTIYSLLSQQDPIFSKWLKTHTSMFGDSNLSSDLASFALEWYISWFCHRSLTDFNQILKLFDFMISSQDKKVGVYMIVAVLLLNKEKLMKQAENNQDFNIVYYIKYEKKMEFKVDEMIHKCGEIMNSNKSWTWTRLRLKLRI